MIVAAMQRAFNIRFLLPRLYGRSPTCSTFSAGQLRLDVSGYRNGGRHQENRKRWHQSGGGQSDRGRSSFPKVGALLAMSWWTVFKDMVGYETIKLDDDPLKAKIKMVRHSIALSN